MSVSMRFPSPALNIINPGRATVSYLAYLPRFKTPQHVCNFGFTVGKDFFILIHHVLDKMAISKVYFV